MHEFLDRIADAIGSETSREVALGQVRCMETMSGLFDVLCTVSFIVSLLAVVMKLRDPKNRTFPDCIPVISCGAAAGFSFSLALSGFFQRKQLTITASNWEMMVCKLQAILLQAFIIMIIWNWIGSMLVMYFIAVLRRPIEEIRDKKQWYFLIISFFVFSTTMYPTLSKEQGEVVVKDFCWVQNDVELQIILLFSHVAIGLLVFSIIAIPVVLALHRASKAALNSTQSGVLKDEMVLQITQACLHFIVFSFIFLHWLNLMLIKDWKGALESTYIAKTGFTFCVMNRLCLACLGLAITLAHSCSPSCCRQIECASPDQLGLEEIQAQLHSQEEPGIYLTVHTPSERQKTSLDFVN